MTLMKATAVTVFLLLASCAASAPPANTEPASKAAFPTHGGY